MKNLEIEDDSSRAKRSITWLRLSEALKREGCPICVQLIDNEEKYIRDILYEYVLDLGVRKKLHQKHGLCSRHAELAIKVERKLNSDGLHLATMFETVLEESIRIIDDEIDQYREHYKKKTRRRKPLKFTDISTCFICDHIDHMEKNLISLFVYYSSDRELHNLYSESESIICYRHVQKMLEAKCDLWVVEKTNEKLKKLITILKSFIQHHSHEYQSDFSEPELGSWIKTINFFSGEYR
ncbi:MAG: DUF6062 family protein [Candidatus Kryptoniota bacterium]